jgi:hypothetical protein
LSHCPSATTLVNCNTSIAQAVHGSRASPRTAYALTVPPDPSTGSGLKAVEGACPEAPRRVERFFELRRQATVTGH